MKEFRHSRMLEVSATVVSASLLTLDPCQLVSAEMLFDPYRILSGWWKVRLEST